MPNHRRSAGLRSVPMTCPWPSACGWPAR